MRRYEKVPGSDPEDLFSVAPITGQVSLHRRIDYEASETKVRLIIVTIINLAVMQCIT